MFVVNSMTACVQHGFQIIAAKKEDGKGIEVRQPN